MGYRRPLTSILEGENDVYHPPQSRDPEALRTERPQPPKRVLILGYDGFEYANAIRKLHPGTIVHVATDLLDAVRELCQNQFSAILSVKPTLATFAPQWDEDAAAEKGAELDSVCETYGIDLRSGNTAMELSQAIRRKGNFPLNWSVPICIDGVVETPDDYWELYHDKGIVLLSPEDVSSDGLSQHAADFLASLLSERGVYKGRR